MPLGLQVAAMAKTFPQFVWDRAARTWTGTLSPRPSSPAYRVRISYDPVRDPITHVLSPDLHSDAPHRFHGGRRGRDGSLCLYLFDDPEAAHWDHRSLVSETIVPWAATWLYFYEVWLENGKWSGPEAPHDPPNLGRRQGERRS